MLKLPKYTKQYLVIPDGKLATTLTFKTRLDARLYKRALKGSTSQIASKIMLLEMDEQGLMYESKEVS